MARRFGRIMLARQVRRLHAYVTTAHVVILGLGHSLQILIEPADDVLQSFHPVPWLSGARSSCDSPGKRTMITGRFRNFSARNISSPPAPGGVRKSASPSTSISGVWTFSM